MSWGLPGLSVQEVCICVVSNKCSTLFLSVVHFCCFDEINFTAALNQIVRIAFAVVCTSAGEHVSPHAEQHILSVSFII